MANGEKPYDNKGGAMIDYNLLTYIGIGLIVGGFVLFLVAEHFEREADKKLFRLKQLEDAFNKAKENERL
mgnify:CR=1 FL=1